MTRRARLVLCNGAPASSASPKYRRGSSKVVLSYTPRGREKANIEVGLPRFVSSVYHLPPRVLDLLEIAAYVFCTDRWIDRGPNDAVEYDAWGRTIHYALKVRDHSFWSSAATKQALSEAITWATGDSSHTFTFLPGHSTPATSLFDTSDFGLDSRSSARVALFSGGIDSLTGAMDHLQTKTDSLYLVSHRSSSNVQSTQQLLLDALQAKHPGRIRSYAFTCRLKGQRAAEETQRSRSFLFCSIAYALSTALQLDTFSIFENGITSLNLPKRESMGLARASRTTHPRTIRLFEELLTLVHGRQFTIETPFFWKTKTDVLNIMKDSGGVDLLDTSVSCTRTFENTDNRTHCGGCSQCVDRRFATAAAGLSEHDHPGLYTTDFVNEPIEDAEVRTFLNDHIGQAVDFARMSADGFIDRYTNELASIEDYLRDVRREDRLSALHDLCRRHGRQTLNGLGALNDLTRVPKDGTLLAILRDREYLNKTDERLSDPEPSPRASAAVAAASVTSKVFISYTHDSIAHQKRVLQLAQDLRRDGIDCIIDQFVNVSPPEGWPLWMERQVESADFVLVVCTATYSRRYRGEESPGRGLGGAWEAILTRQELYEAHGSNLKFVPVLFEGASVGEIPQVLRPYTHHRLPEDYMVLLRYLTNQPGVLPRRLGRIPALPAEPDSMEHEDGSGPSDSTAEMGRALPTASTATEEEMDFVQTMELIAGAHLPSRKEGYRRAARHTHCQHRNQLVEVLVSKLKGFSDSTHTNDKEGIIRLLDRAKAWEIGPQILEYWISEGARIQDPLTSTLRGYFIEQLDDAPGPAVEFLTKALLRLASIGKPDQPTRQLIFVVANAAEEKSGYLKPADWTRIDEVLKAYEGDEERFEDLKRLRRTLGYSR